MFVRKLSIVPLIIFLISAPLLSARALTVQEYAAGGDCFWLIITFDNGDVTADEICPGSSSGNICSVGRIGGTGGNDFSSMLQVGGARIYSPTDGWSSIIGVDTNNSIISSQSFTCGGVAGQTFSMYRMLDFLANNGLSDDSNFSPTGAVFNSASSLRYITRLCDNHENVLLVLDTCTAVLDYSGRLCYVASNNNSCILTASLASIPANTTAHIEVVASYSLPSNAYDSTSYIHLDSNTFMDSVITAVPDTTFFYGLAQYFPGGAPAHKIIAGTKEDLNLAISALSVVPNPASSGNVSVSFTSTSSGVAQLEIFNILGQAVLQKNISCVDGINMQKLSVAGLPAGTYTAQITEGTERISAMLTVSP